MSNLKQSIQCIPGGRIAFSTITSTVTYNDLFELIKTNKHQIRHLKNANVVINGSSRLDFVKLLVLLDGEVGSILFLSPGMDHRDFNGFYNEAQINYEVHLEDNLLQFKTIKPHVESEEKSKESIGESAWIIPTSGTTDIPKLVSHTFSTLTRTVKRDIQIGNHYIWGLVFDIYRFSGIQVFLQSLLCGSTLAIPEMGHNISNTLNDLIENHCNALSATPSFWRKVLMSKESNELAFKVITLGGEIVDKNILMALRAKFPEAKILHIYASTEAGVGFSVTDGQAGFPKSYLEQTTGGITLKISAKNTLLINHGKPSQKYLSNDGLYQKNGFIDTGDIVKVEGVRVFFQGRDSGAINVGGNKVQPEEVENVLLDSGLISAAYVYPKKSPIMGNLVCADLVPKENKSELRQIKLKILRFARTRLNSYKVPAIIRFVNEIQTTQSGKINRSI